MRPKRAKLPRGVAACYAVTPFGLQLLLSDRLDERRSRLAMRAIELMVARLWTMAVVTDADLATAIDRLDAKVFRPPGSRAPTVVLARARSARRPR